MYMRIICIFFLFHYTQAALLDLSCRDIGILVDMQNYARLLLAKGFIENLPPASEMNSMVWDEELAAKAAKWASTYPTTTNPDPSIPSGRFFTSQAISLLADNDEQFKINPKVVVLTWQSEHLNYTYGPFSEEIVDPSHAPIGHYTQMIWSNSIYLGCAISENIEDELKKYYVVCEYGPSGNILGQEPYKTGPPSNNIKCVADEDHCKHPYGANCPDEVDEV